jgi:hypothetical protein
MYTRLDYLDTVGNAKRAEHLKDFFIMDAHQNDALPDYIRRVTVNGMNPDSRYWHWLIDKFEALRLCPLCDKADCTGCDG